MSVISIIQSAINKLRRMDGYAWQDGEDYDLGYSKGYRSALEDLEEIFIESDTDDNLEAKPPRRFMDERYPDKIIMEDELRREYEMDDIRFDLTFHQYLRNCMQEQGGTLKELFD